MFTDIQGYTALMQENEEKAIQVRDKHRRIFNSITEKHKGRVLQYYGDGTLSIFDSAIDAVECGIEMQLEFQKDPVIPVRVGIHEGDILLSEEEIIGDGVNIASRIESLAVSGSVFISDKIYDDIKNQKSITTKRMGSFVLKNVKNPVDVYAISNDGLMVPSKDQIKGKVKETIEDQSITKSINRSYLRKYQIPGILSLILVITAILFYMNEGFKGVGSDVTIDRSIAIIPFVNLSNDKEQDYFSDGISEDILTQISNIGDLRVISRSSVMRYKNTKMPSQEIAKELGVNHILEGSVRKYGDKMRIAVQLIDIKSDKLLWARTFDHRKVDDVFVIQSQVSKEVAKALKAELTLQEEEDINKKPTENIEAYELYLQGLYHLRSGSMEGLKKSYPLLQQAIDLDSEFAEAYAGIADYYINLGAWRGDLTPELASNEAMPYVMRALELDPNLKNARNQLGTIKWWFEWDFAGAEKEYIKGKSPGNQGHYYGFFLMLMGRFSEAEEHFVKSHQLNPMDVYDRTHRGVIQYYLNNHERSIEILKEGIDLFPNALTGYHKLGKIYLNVGNYREAIKILEQGMVLANERIPSFLGELSIAYFKSGQPEKTEEIIEELKSFESKGSQGSPSFFLAQIYAGIGELGLAFKWLEKSYKAHDVEMIWLKIEPQFNSLRNDPRFTELLERVGFTDYNENET
jgi:TolB-like protein